MDKKYIIISCIISIVILVLIGFGITIYLGDVNNVSNVVVNDENIKRNNNILSEKTCEEIHNNDNNKNFEYEFKKEEIPQQLKNKMQGVTISSKSHVTFDDLCCLTISYYGYDDKIHVGQLIVNKKLGDEVLNIFKELLEIKFPIEKMKPACEYGGDDEKSMSDNNTSAFNDRPIEGSGGLSYHQLGTAIDINPLINPYIRLSDNTVLPTNARKYLKRDEEYKGIIKEGGSCVSIFEKYGWTWGGNWKSLKDYQYFEKDIN